MCSIPDHDATHGDDPDDVVVDPPRAERGTAARPAGPGFTGFGAEQVRSITRSHSALAAARLLAATDPTALTDDECLGVFDDLEVLQRSIDAIGVMVLTEIDDRDLCDTRYGTTSHACGSNGATAVHG